MSGTTSSINDNVDTTVPWPPPSGQPYMLDTISRTQKRAATLRKIAAAFLAAAIICGLLTFITFEYLSRGEYNPLDVFALLFACLTTILTPICAVVSLVLYLIGTTLRFKQPQKRDVSVNSWHTYPFESTPMVESTDRTAGSRNYALDVKEGGHCFIAQDSADTKDCHTARYESGCYIESTAERPNN